mmetsp:Transcript_47525/g.146380  ORF Transcript_47525/g.146380 Transcript_47525/m.146380 type:complete len:225 (-) Transcript_47525:289-963(-)
MSKGVRGPWLLQQIHTFCPFHSPVQSGAAPTLPLISAGPLPPTSAMVSVSMTALCPSAHTASGWASESPAPSRLPGSRAKDSAQSFLPSRDRHIARNSASHPYMKPVSGMESSSAGTDSSSAAAGFFFTSVPMSFLTHEAFCILALLTCLHMLLNCLARLSFHDGSSSSVSARAHVAPLATISNIASACFCENTRDGATVTRRGQSNGNACKRDLIIGPAILSL